MKVQRLSKLLLAATFNKSQFTMSDVNCDDVGRRGVQRLNDGPAARFNQTQPGREGGQTQLCLDRTDVFVYFPQHLCFENSFLLEMQPLLCSELKCVVGKVFPFLFLRFSGIGFLVLLKQCFFFFSSWQHLFSLVSNCSILEEIIVENLLTHLLANAFLW